jgi:CRP-like cAMP-binding protein
VIDVLFAVDILLNFNTTYNSSEDVFDCIFEENRINIAIRYLKFWFWIDLISTVPIDDIAMFVAGDKNLMSIRLIRTVRFFRLAKLARLIKLKALIDLLDEYSIDPSIIGIFVLFVEILFMVHVICCLWYYIATPASGADPTDNWLVILFGSEWKGVNSVDKYVASFYFIVMTMTTVGYGDIRPSNYREQFLMIFLLPILAVMFGALINKVTKAILLSNPQASGLKSRMDDLKGYLSEKHIPTAIKDDAIAAYVYFFRKKSLIGESGVFEELPKQILNKLVQSIYKEEICTIDVFKKENCQQEFVVDLLINSKPFQARAGEIIADQEDIAEDIFFIMKGVVAISTYEESQRSYINAGYCSQGGYVGDFEFLKRTNRIARYTSQHASDIISVPYSVLADAISNHIKSGTMFTEELIERYEQFQKNVMFYDTKGSSNMCNACSHTYTSDNDKKKHRVDFLRSARLCSTCDTSCGSEVCFEGHELICQGGGNIVSIDRDELARGKFLESYYAQVKMLTTERLRQVCREKGLSESVVLDNFHFLTGTEKYEQERNILLSRLLQRAHVDSYVIKSRRNLFVDGRILNVQDTLNKSKGKSNKDNDIDEKLVITGTEEYNNVSQEYIVPMTDIDSKGQMQVVERNPNILWQKMLIYHKNTWKKRWDVIIGVLIIYSVIEIPVELAFGLGSNKDLAAFDIFVTVMFFLDMFAAFRTTYDDEKFELVEAVPSKIVARYLKSWFFIDAISTIPFDEIASQFISSSNLSGLRIVRVIRLTRSFRLLRLTKVMIYIEKFESISGLSPAVLDLCKSLLIIFLSAHFIGCLWWGITSFGSESTGAWYDHKVMFYADADQGFQYIASVYWALVTIDSVGYGDIFPTNTLERIISIFIMLVGTTFFGYMVASVSGLLGSLNRSSTIINDRIAEISAYLSERNCPRELCISVKRYFTKFFETSTAYNEREILNNLPSMIKNEILFHQHRATIDRIAIFEFIKNKTVVLYIFDQIKMRYYEKDSVVIREGNSSEGIIFMISGTAVLTKATSKEVLEKKFKSHKEKLNNDFFHKSVSTESIKSGRIGKMTTSMKKYNIEYNKEQERKRKRQSSFRMAHMFRRVPSKISKLEYIDGDMYLGDLIPGQFVGHFGTMRQENHKATVTTTSGCTFYILTKEACQKIITEHPGVAFILQTAIGKASAEQASTSAYRDLISNKKKVLMALKTHNVVQNKRRHDRKIEGAIEKATKTSSTPAKIQDLNFEVLKDVTVDAFMGLGDKLNLKSVTDNARRNIAVERWMKIRREIKTAQVTASLAPSGLQDHIVRDRHARATLFSKVFKAQTGVGIDEIVQIELAKKRDEDAERERKIKSIQNTYTNSRGELEFRRHNSLPIIYFNESVERSTIKFERKFNPSKGTYCTTRLLSLSDFTSGNEKLSSRKPVVDLLLLSGLVSSKDEGKRLIKAALVKVNGVTVTEEAAMVSQNDFNKMGRLKLSTAFAAETPLHQVLDVRRADEVIKFIPTVTATGMTKERYGESSKIFWEYVEPKICFPSKEYVEQFDGEIIKQQTKLGEVESGKDTFANPGEEHEHQLFVKRRVTRSMSFPPSDYDKEEWKGLLTDKCVL